MLFLISLAILLIFRGSGGLVPPFGLFLAGVFLYRGRPHVLAAALILACFSMIAPQSTSGAALLLFGGLLLLSSSKDIPASVPVVLSVSWVALAGEISGLAALVPACFAALLCRRIWMRAGVLYLGLAISVLVSGLPRCLVPAPGHADAQLRENSVSWSFTGPLDLENPKILLEAQGVPSDSLEITVSAGGTRDDEPLGRITSGGTSAAIMPGISTVRILSPVFPVEVEMTRDWKPFNHPVIHFLGAESSLD